MLTPREIAEGLSKECNRLEELETEILLAAKDAARSEADYKIAFAKARISRRLETAAGTKAPSADIVDDHATVATEETYYARLLASNNLTVLREALRSTGIRINALQTLSRSHDAATR